jgi:acyl transferase domain-containing protein/acyl carrier protein
VKGLVFDWNRLYGKRKPKRISLPTYPFAREHCWIPVSELRLLHNANGLSHRPGQGLLHPLVHQNTSELGFQRFSTKFSGQEFFLRDHMVQGRRVLPGVVYLEMAREAVEQACASRMAQEGKAIKFKHVVWAHPVVVEDEEAAVHIELYEDETSEIGFEIYSLPEGEEYENRIIHSQGRAELTETSETTSLDLEKLRSQCKKESFTPEQCYEAFKKMGLEYGPGQRALQSVSIGEQNERRFLLAQVSLPDSLAETHPQYVLHPAVMDAALQALIGISLADDIEGSTVALPFALDGLEIVDRIPRKAWVWVRETDSAGNQVQKVDVDICDESGMVRMRLQGFSTRVLDARKFNNRTMQEKKGRAIEDNKPETLLLRPMYVEEPAHMDTLGKYPEHWVLLLCDLEAGSEHKIELAAELPAAHCLTLHSTGSSTAERLQEYAGLLVDKLQEIASKKDTHPVLVQLVIPNHGERELFSALNGILKTAQLETPRLHVQAIGLEAEQTMAAIAAKIKENCGARSGQMIRYVQGKRQVLIFEEVPKSTKTNPELVFKPGGVYLITGGAGGLGLLLAREIAQQAKEVSLILAGRSVLNDEKMAEIKALKEMGAQVEYLCVDVAERSAVDRLLEEIQIGHKTLNGILHSAGVLRDSFLVYKTQDELRAVLAPKVQGVVNLDEATSRMELDFFVMFSSMAGVLGNVGQADYATGNAFMDIYARYRNDLVATGRRHGQSLSIDWPLWAEGGMNVPPAALAVVRERMGLVPLSTERGISAFYQALALGESQVLVLSGEGRRLRATLLRDQDHVQTEMQPVRQITAFHMTEELNTLHSRGKKYFKKLVGAALKVPPDRLEADTPFENYGIDSVMVMHLTGELETSFGSLSKTLLYEYQTIEQLTHYFVQQHSSQLRRLVGLQEENTTPAVGQVEQPAAPARNKTDLRPGRIVRRAQPRGGIAADARQIAIIGISGRFPQARNVEELWENLKGGKDCISEIPGERWDLNAYFDPQKGKPGKSYSKWGGFLDGIDQFDPLFFNISPREAQYMDPQERLFLETVWNLLETTGYTRDLLQQLYQAKVGVYVGSMYQQFGSFASRSAIPNRISHYFGLQGPSMAIDTMCSSAAVAIHTACNDLISGDCLLAIAGGVNLTTHPAKYVTLSQWALLGSHANSRSFGDGDGYLPSEAVGALLLKPLVRAAADRDNILGVIKATAVNHNGRSNGYSVPNPCTQAQVIEDAVTKAGIDPRTISYVEAAAAGSGFGDSIELTALNRVFEKFTADRQFCAIGSVKSNLGHAEAGSGMTQLAKVVLQLQNRQLAPSIKAEPLNPNVCFDGTAFFLQSDRSEWKRPVITAGMKERTYPRRALLDSFGAGGTNACLIVEEYEGGAERSADCRVKSRPQVIVFSARNKGRLAEIVRQIIEHIKNHTTIRLADLAYTLQVGREAMSSRLAMVVTSCEELLQGLEAYLRGIEKGCEIEAPIPVFAAEVTDHSTIKALTEGRTGDVLLQALLAEGDVERLALFWTQGGRIPWPALHLGEDNHIVPLPTYPFEKIRFPLPAHPMPGNQNGNGTSRPEPDGSDIAGPHGLPGQPAGVPHVAPCSTTVAPRTELERTVHAIWEEVLGISGIGVQDNFLEFGGNSIQAAEILAKVHQAFSIEIPMQTVLGSQPTIAGMTVAIVSELAKLQEVYICAEHVDSVVS